MYVSSIDLSKYSPLGSVDYPTFTLYDSIIEVIKQRSSPEAAAILAEPIFDDGSQVLDYTVAEGNEVRRLNELSADDKNTALDKLEKYADEIQALSTRYIQSNDSHAMRLGQNLRYALFVPDSEAIYVVGGQPVITGWGLRHRVGSEPFNISDAQSLRVDVSAAILDETLDALRQPKITHNPPSQNRKNRSYSPWFYVLLAFLGLLLFLLLLLLLFPNKNIKSTTSASLDQNVQNTSQQTSEALPGSISPQQPLGNPKNSSLDFVSDHNLEVPVSAIETGDMSFLRGDWISTTDLYGTVSNKPVVVLYTFDQDGAGITTIAQESNADCKAAVKAEFKSDGRLYIQDQSDVFCNEGVSFKRSTVICDISHSGQAVCSGYQGKNKYNVTFKRAINK